MLSVISVNGAVLSFVRAPILGCRLDRSVSVCVCRGGGADSLKIVSPERAVLSEVIARALTRGGERAMATGNVETIGTDYTSTDRRHVWARDLNSARSTTNDQFSAERRLD